MSLCAEILLASADVFLTGHLGDYDQFAVQAWGNPGGHGIVTAGVPEAEKDCRWSGFVKFHGDVIHRTGGEEGRSCHWQSSGRRNRVCVATSSAELNSHHPMNLLACGQGLMSQIRTVSWHIRVRVLLSNLKSTSSHSQSLWSKILKNSLRELGFHGAPFQILAVHRILSSLLRGTKYSPLHGVSCSLVWKHNQIFSREMYKQDRHCP